MLWVCSAAACGQPQPAGGENAISGTPEGPTIAIGVSADQPGIGAWRNGTYTGFEIDVARYVANELGYANKQIVFKQVTSTTRVAMLNDGKVDFVVGYAIADAGRQVTMTGPYLTARRDLLVRDDDRKAIRGLDDMAGRTVCVVTGTSIGADIRKKAPKAVVEERDDYEQCFTSLMVGSSDAIAAGDAILQGISSAKGKGYLHVVGDPYGEEQYGIAVRLGEERLASDISGILEDMIEDGSWAKAAQTLHDETGYTPDRRLNPPDPVS
ncbi:ABC transporter substrate-binding protein [Bifidobacterium leontopitheci]|uniref:ABC transporter substrate-binding protein n=2 Tax=Bifidobacterium leontopitheci TaxID=2650774 RepID=A0A6I1GN78_9BIFI|nr:ABC transporter substrate-binding protein [Bifidobacterium leontopitheci]